MFTNETVKKLATKLQTSEINIRREYFQHLFLSLFYNQKETSQIYFKGGTALRIIYNSPRFSEDLDFDSSSTDIQLIESAIITTLSEIQKSGVETEIDEAKRTNNGYLATMRFSFLGYIVPIRIEISFRDMNKKGEAIFITNDMLPDYMILQLIQGQLIEGKMAALLDRKKPRDFYDLYFILRANLLPVEKRTLLKEVLDILKNSNISFDKELREFLPQNQWLIIKDFSSSLEREIKRFI